MFVYSYILMNFMFIYVHSISYLTHINFINRFYYWKCIFAMNLQVRIMVVIIFLQRLGRLTSMRLSQHVLLNVTFAILILILSIADMTLNCADWLDLSDLSIYLSCRSRCWSACPSWCPSPQVSIWIKCTSPI